MTPGTHDPAGDATTSARLRTDLLRRTGLLAEVGDHLQTGLREILRHATELDPSNPSTALAAVAATIRRGCEQLLADLADATGSVPPDPTVPAPAEPFDLHTALRATVANEALAAAGRRNRLRCYVHRDVPRHVAGDGPGLRALLGTLLQDLLVHCEDREIPVYVSLESLHLDDCVIRVSLCDRDGGAPSPSPADLLPGLDAAAPTGTPLRTTLRLSTLRERLRRLNGRLGVEADEAHGCTVWFTVPLQVVAESADHRVLAPHHPVLLVSNCPERIPQVLIALQRRGFVVELEQDHQLFLERMRRCTCSLVLVDRVLGPHTAAFARASAGAATVPVVGVPLVAGTTDRVDEEALLRLVQRWVEPTRSSG